MGWIRLLVVLTAAITIGLVLLGMLTKQPRYFQLAKRTLKVAGITLLLLAAYFLILKRL